MDKRGYKITVGGIVIKDNSILLVKHNYGHTKGRWDFPRGYVEIDELMNNSDISGWTKQIVSASINNKGLTDSNYLPKSNPCGTIYWKTYLDL